MPTYYMFKKQQQSPLTERSEDLPGGLCITATLNNSKFNQYAIKEKKKKKHTQNAQHFIYLSLALI